MLRSEVISTCLINSDYFDDFDSARRAVRQIFAQTFPSHSFESWDKYISEQEANYHIERLKASTEIDFHNLVLSLSKPATLEA